MKKWISNSQIKNLAIIVSIGLLMGACSARDNRMGQGALIGGAGGALIGGLASGTGTGAVIGGVVGAATGAIVADATRPRWRHRNSRCRYSNVNERMMCRR